MIGIDNDVLDKIIKINNINIDSVKKFNTNLIETINELNASYSGKSLNFAFSTVLEQTLNLKKMEKVFIGYSNVLQDVKKSYLNQDNVITSAINHKKSQIK